MAADRDVIDLSQFRNLVRGYIDRHLYESALYWADKVCTLSNNDPQDVLWLGNCMFLTGQFHRTIHLLKHEPDLLEQNLEARYLVARCYASLKEWMEVLNVLESVELCSLRGDSLPSSDSADHKVRSAVYLLRGLAYDSLDMAAKEAAVEAYKEALRYDVFCFEAFDALVSHYVLPARDEKDLFDLLLSDPQLSPQEIAILNQLYGGKVQKYTKPSLARSSKELELLVGNSDVAASFAERHYNNGNYRAAYAITSDILKQDPYDLSCMLLHVSLLFELKKKTELFELSKSLVGIYADRPISWYSIGAYYLLVNKNNMARQYFGKALSFQHNYSPAWLGFAHSFANDGEHERAIPAYSTAALLMPGSHVPLMYLGLEHVTISKDSLAKSFFKQALAISPDDPLLKHELGTLHYNSGQYDDAQRFFSEALQRLEVCSPDFKSDLWEPLLNNLGHVARQLNNFDQSLDYHKRALFFHPKSASTYTSIGLVLCQKKEFDGALTALNRALRYKQEDPLCLQLMSLALEGMAAASRSKPESFIVDDQGPSTGGENKEMSISENDEMSMDETI